MSRGRFPGTPNGRYVQLFEQVTAVSVNKRSGSFEFLQFLADISNPATGEISAERLAPWLCQTEKQLISQWNERGSAVPWTLFADELLAVLDAAQDRTFDLNLTVEWYLNKPISSFGMSTPQEIVVKGKARMLVVALRAGEIHVP